MKLIDRLFFFEIIGVFSFVAAVFTGIVWIALGPIEAALKYVNMGIPGWLIIKIATLNIPPIFVYAFPISTLLAAIITFVRLSDNSEAVALFASGVSIYRMLVPTALAAACVTILGLFINNTAAPYAVATVTNFKKNISREIRQASEPFTIPVTDKEGRLTELIWVEGGYDDVTHSLTQVTINKYDPKTGRLVLSMYADSAVWQGGTNFSLKNAIVLGVGSLIVPAALTVQDLHTSPADLADFEVDPDTLGFAQLARLIERLRRAHAPGVRQDETSLWEKIALPFASLIFAMVGAPLGLRPQRGYPKWIAFFGGFAVILVYYVLRELLEILAAGGNMDPFLAAFLPDLAGIVAAAYLIWRAPT